MTWGRYDDNYCDWKTWEGVSFAARWHYQALVQLCCRQERWDGRIPPAAARRASDVDDPDGCVDELLAAGGLLGRDGDVVVVLRIDEHIPPAWVRKNAEQSKIRMRRHRKHRAGDHSECLPEHCDGEPVTRNESSNDVTVTDDVTRNVPRSRPVPSRRDRDGREGRARPLAVTRNGPRHHDPEVAAAESAISKLTDAGRLALRMRAVEALNGDLPAGWEHDEGHPWEPHVYARMVRIMREDMAAERASRRTGT